MSAGTPPTESTGCAEPRERLLDYLYGELGEAERAAFERHLSGCDACGRELSSYKRVREAAAALPDEEPSSTGMAALLAAAGVAPAPALAIVASNPSARSASEGGSSSVVKARGLRRVLRHPGFAAAATFAIVGSVAGWQLLFHRADVLSPPTAIGERYQHNAETHETAKVSAVEAPSASPAKTAPAANDDREVSRARPAAAAGAVAAPTEEAADRPARGDSEPKKEPAYAPAPARRATHGRDRDDVLAPEFDVAAGEGVGAGGLGGLGGAGSGAGYGAGGAGAGSATGTAGRAAARSDAPSPKIVRKPSGQGVWLDERENQELARSTTQGSAQGPGASPAAALAQPAQPLAPVAAAPAPVAAAPAPVAAAPAPVAAAPAPVVSAPTAASRAAPPATRSFAAPPPPAEKSARAERRDEDELADAKASSSVSADSARAPAAAWNGVVGVTSAPGKHAAAPHRPSALQIAITNYQTALHGQDWARALESYREILALDRAHRFVPDERLGHVVALTRSGQLAPARQEIAVLRAEEPSLSSKLDALEREIDKSSVKAKVRPAPSNNADRLPGN